MSKAQQTNRAVFKKRASLFAALGDETRLSLVGRLSNSTPLSITRLSEGSTLTRQAVSRHLRVLENAGVVRQKRFGRESRYAFRPEAFKQVRSYLDYVASQWDDALARLKSFVES